MPYIEDRIQMVDGKSTKTLGVAAYEAKKFVTAAAVRTEGISVASLVQLARSSIVTFGYGVTRVDLPILPAPHHLLGPTGSRGFVFAERGVTSDRRATRTSFEVAGGVALTGALLGVGLALISHNLEWLFPFVLFFGVGGLLVLSVWGIAYSEECVFVSVEVPPSAASAAEVTVDQPIPAVVTWRTGRVGSRIRSGKAMPSYRSISTVTSTPETTSDNFRLVHAFSAAVSSAGGVATPVSNDSSPVI
ncbi:MAG: hypothetical protein L3K07_05515 [Thermoplasmata archaeon]|nr:hypothetical protein [Thermoplasmata archaeon]